MNIYDPELDRKPGRDEAEAAFAVLKRWADRASEADIVALDPAVGALLGGMIGQAFDNSARPLALALLACGVVTLALVALKSIAIWLAGPLCTEPTKSVGLGNCSADSCRRLRKS